MASNRWLVVLAIWHGACNVIVQPGAPNKRHVVCRAVEDNFEEARASGRALCHKDAIVTLGGVHFWVARVVVCHGLQGCLKVFARAIRHDTCAVLHLEQPDVFGWDPGHLYNDINALLAHEQGLQRHHGLVPERPVIRHTLRLGE